MTDTSANVDAVESAWTVPRASDARVLIAGGLLTAVVLVLTASSQIYDTNYSALWEAAALLAGDHPYRDFYEWGALMTGILSTVAQLLVGYRLIGEFGLQWLCIIAGAVLSLHLALRLSGSITASVVTGLLALSVLPVTPTYSYPKLLVYPLALWLACRYMDRPGRARIAALGVATTIAFLFRHDHGLHTAVAAALALVLTRLLRPGCRNLRALVTEGATYGAVAMATVAPWVILVQSSEGIPEYLRQRMVLYRGWAVDESPFGTLLTLPTDGDPLTRLYWVTLLVPVLLAVSVVTEVVRSWYRAEPLPVRTWYFALTAAILALIDDQIVREPSYVVAVAPLTAAAAAPLLAWSGRHGAAWKGVQLAIGTGLVIVAGVASVSYTNIEPEALIGRVQPTFSRLLASPPIEGILPADRISGFTRELWERGGDENERLMLRYLHDCTAPGDRVIVTGSTPSEVNYLIERPFAGGHLLWHHAWRSDPVQEMRSLVQIQRQSVPFAYSNTDPVLDDFEKYPRIRAYLTEHYAELDGSTGLLLVDTRRTPVRRFGPMGFPCFR